jgi:hypothetical protein
MPRFKVGDKVRRTSGVSVELLERTGIRKGGVYTVCVVSDWDASIKLAESKEATFYFDADMFTLEASWDVNEALRLRDLAVQAIQEYNTYLLQQPLLEAIDIPPIK